MNVEHPHEIVTDPDELARRRAAGERFLPLSPSEVDSLLEAGAEERAAFIERRRRDLEEATAIRPGAPDLDYRRLFERVQRLAPVVQELGPQRAERLAGLVKGLRAAGQELLSATAALEHEIGRALAQVGAGAGGSAALEELRREVADALEDPKREPLLEVMADPERNARVNAALDRAQARLAARARRDAGAPRGRRPRSGLGLLVLGLLVAAGCGSPGGAGELAPEAGGPFASARRPRDVGARPDLGLQPLRRRHTLWGEQWPEADDPWAGQPLEYVDTLFLAGHRSGLFSGHAGGIDDVTAWAARRPVTLIDCTILPQESNYPPAVGKAGTYWGSRAHLISDCDVDGLVVRDLFGSSYGGGQLPLVTSNEGHAIYWTLAPGPESRYVLRRLDVRNLGGHGIQFVTAVGARDGLDAPPRPGGELWIQDAYFENTDRAPARGSSTISLFDLPLETHLERVVVRHGVNGATYPTWGWDGTPGDAYTARGCLVQRGDMIALEAEACAFVQLGGRPDRSAVSLRGVRVATFRRCRFEGDLVVNYPHDWVERWTQRLVLEDCSGSGSLWVGKSYVGPIAGRSYDLKLDGPSLEAIVRAPGEVLEALAERRAVVRTIDDSAHDRELEAVGH